MYKDFAPLLSAQLSTAPVGRPRVILNLLPAAPVPAQLKDWVNPKRIKEVRLRYMSERIPSNSECVLTAFRHFAFLRLPKLSPLVLPSVPPRRRIIPKLDKLYRLLGHVIDRLYITWAMPRDLTELNSWTTRLDVVDAIRTCKLCINSLSWWF